MPIEEKRKKIDSVDEKILTLLNDRAKLAKGISVEKGKNGAAVYVPERERAVLKNIISKNKGPLSNKALESIYRNIVSECRALEASLKIAYLGPATTFTHMAAIKNFGSSCEFIPLNSINDVFAEVEKGSADYGVVPIENSTEGTINHTLDTFMKSNLNIVAEIMLDIKHNLLSKHKLSEIKKIYSRPSALAQCRGWISNNLPKAEIIESSSTAKAAELATLYHSSAAIASELAAEQYSLKIVSKNIQDSAHNVTRFLVIGKTKPKRSTENKTSIMFSVKNEPGTLFNALESFPKNGINMTKIESRPARKKGWDVVFFIDFEGYVEDKNIQKALEGIKESCVFVKILGSYPLEVTVSE
jgi:chorismate mutase/prephenate dehydratase